MERNERSLQGRRGYRGKVEVVVVMVVLWVDRGKRDRWPTTFFHTTDWSIQLFAFQAPALQKLDGDTAFLVLRTPRASAEA